MERELKFVSPEYQERLNKLAYFLCTERFIKETKDHKEYIKIPDNIILGIE